MFERTPLIFRSSSLVNSTKPCASTFALLFGAFSPAAPAFRFFVDRELRFESPRFRSWFPCSYRSCSRLADSRLPRACSIATVFASSDDKQASRSDKSGSTSAVGRCRFWPPLSRCETRWPTSCCTLLMVELARRREVLLLVEPAVSCDSMCCATARSPPEACPPLLVLPALAVEEPISAMSPGEDADALNMLFFPPCSRSAVVPRPSS
mmetsp:Transcript_10111/g.24882  ORF Transcript_10111/g.24882 Transcript_10111/m.24882 type:complete len:209 (-) Transcript_10111:989-1615(-)